MAAGYTTTQPLTTIFTPPSSCQTKWTYEGSYYNSITGGMLIQQALDGEPDSNCFPSGFDSFGRAPGMNNIYSPGYCPVGYTTAGNAYNGAITTATCCPSGFGHFSTVSALNYDSSTANFEGCTSMFASKSATTVPGRANNDDLSTTTVTGPMTMWAQPVFVAYRQQDLTLFTTSIPSTTSTTSSTAQTSQASSIASATGSSTSSSSSIQSQSTTTSTSTTSVTPTTTPPPAPSGLSGGAIAGIAIAAALIVGLSIGLALFFRRRKHRSSNQHHNPAAESQSAYYSDNNPHGNGNGYGPEKTGPKFGNNGEQYNELHNPHWQPSELDAQRAPQEMALGRGGTMKQQSGKQASQTIGSPVELG